MMSFIGLSVRIVTKSPQVGPLLIFSISLEEGKKAQKKKDEVNNKDGQVCRGV
jgi:hypothetical protein